MDRHNEGNSRYSQFCERAIINFESQAKRQSKAVTADYNHRRPHRQLAQPTKQTNITRVTEVAGVGQTQITSPRTVYLRKIGTKSL
jgi:hypothetical protein